MGPVARCTGANLCSDIQASLYRPPAYVRACCKHRGPSHKYIFIRLDLESGFGLVGHACNFHIECELVACDIVCHALSLALGCKASQLFPDSCIQQL